MPIIGVLIRNRQQKNNFILTNVYDSNGLIAHEWVVHNSGGYRVTAAYDERLKSWTVKHSRTQINLNRHLDRSQRISEEMKFSINFIDKDMKSFEELYDDIADKKHTDAEMHKVRKDKYSLMRRNRLSRNTAEKH